MTYSEFEHQYEKLNEAQKNAVDAIDGPVLVIAGPGSGKTQILSMRVANILRQTDTLPSAILCLSFTDAAATNMKERLRKIIGVQSHHVAVHTFHSFCTEIINQCPEFFFDGIEYRPADPLTKISIVQQVLEKLPLENPLRSYHPEKGWVYLNSVESRIAELKKAGLTPQAYKRLLEENEQFINTVDEKLSIFFDTYQRKAAAHSNELLAIFQEFKGNKLNEITLSTPKPLHHLLVDSLAEVVVEIQNSEKKNYTKPFTAWAKIFTQKDAEGKTHLKDAIRMPKLKAFADVYDKILMAMHAEKLFDFDDMLIQVTQALKKFPELRYNLQERYLYFLVDEFQDTSGGQNELIDLLISSEINGDLPNIMAVGDDDQAIYKFQGASLSNILQFTEKYPAAIIVNMVQNYRSTQLILDYAMTVVDQVQQRLTQLPNVSKQLKSEIE